MAPKHTDHANKVSKTSKGKEIAGEEVSKHRVKRAKGNDGEASKKKKMAKGAPSSLRLQKPLRVEEEEESDDEGILFTKEENDDYNHQVTILHRPTHFLRDKTLEAMGLKDDVYAMLRNMGLEKFATLRSFVFPDLARDFFATVEFVYEGGDDPHPDNGRLSFKLHGREYTISIKEVCEVYGFPYGDKCHFKHFEQANEFWDLIAIGKTTGTPKNSLIRNPAIRIVAKFLANTLFARNETGTIKLVEIHMLYKGLYPFLMVNGTPMFKHSQGLDVNVGCIFACELVRIRKWAKDASDRICRMAGMLAPLWEYVGIPYKTYRFDPRTCPMDGRQLTNVKVLVVKDGRRLYSYLNRSKESRTLQLPCPEKVSLVSLENITFEHGEELDRNNTNVASSSSAPIHTELPSEITDVLDWEIPPLDFPARTKKDKAFLTIIKNQMKIIKQLSWVKRKIKTLAGYKSDEDTNEGNGIEELGAQKNVDEAETRQSNEDGWDEVNHDPFVDETYGDIPN